ncbi:MAG: monooxygenase, partial [Pseudomonadota bacterium]|nr:monooxygenase [Pseudomonadota bacterium]
MTGWLGKFEKALSASDTASLQALFLPDAHWRDLLAFTWQVKTVSGSPRIIKELTGHAVGARGFEIDHRRTPPRRVTRAGTSVIEAIFRFETPTSRAHGVLRLLPEGEAGKCWTLLTALDEIKGFEESVESRRPRGEGRDP